jgi:hypothetical protein
MKRTAFKQTPPKRLPAAEAFTYHWYGEEFPYDEIGRWMGCRVRDGKFRMFAERLDIYGNLQRHHIVRVGRRRHLRSVLIVVTEENRHWVQSVCPNEGLVACVLSKLRKMESLGDPAEFDLDEVALANGGKSVKAEIEAFVFEEERWRTWQEETLERLGKLVTT